MKKVSPSRYPDSLLDCIIQLREFLLPLYGRNEVPPTTRKARGLGLHEIVELLGQAILKLSIQYGLPSRVEHGVEVVDQRLGR